MKHFTAFATTLLLWLCAITAWADGVVVADTYTAANDITEGYYLIKTRFKGANYFVYHKTTSNANRPFQMKAEASVDKTTLGSNLQYVWYITKNANGLLVIQNASTGVFFPAHNGNGGDFNQSTAIANAAIYEAKTFTPYTNSLEGGVYLRETNYGTNYNVHANKANGQDPDLSYWEGGSISETSSLVQFTFYKLTLPDGTTTQATPAYGAQIKHKIGNEVISSSWSVGLKTTQIQPTTNKSYYYTTANTLTYGDAATTADMSLTYTRGNTPITLSTPDNPTYYRFQLRNQKGDSYCAVYQDDNNVKTSSSTYNKANYYLLRDAHWVVIESGFGVKLYNAAAKKYVTVSGADAKATMTDQGTTFYMQTTTYTGANFSLQYAGNSYLGDHKSSYLGTWTYSEAQNNDGSGFKAIAVDDTDLTTATALVGNILPKAFSSQTNNDNALTMNTAEAAEKGKALVEKYNSSEPKTWSLLDEIAFTTDVNFSAQPDLNAYYRIRNVNSGLANRYLSSENIVVATNGSLATAYVNSQGSIDRKITRKSDSDNFGSQLWKFTNNNDGTFTIRNANTDREMGEATTTSIEMPINIGAGNGHYKFMPYTEDAFTDYDANSMFIMYDVNGNQVGINGENYIFRNNDHFNEKSNYWQIIKVTEVPVMISTTAGWASVAYPFAVQVPSDVKAYIAATAEDDVLTLQEITDGIIPANTGALLTKDGGGLVNLTITTTSTTYADNKLTASTAERSGFTAKDTYVLAAKSGKVGLYPSTLTIVPSNKAYLLKTNITTTASGEAQMMNFVVDGTVTGINAVESNVNKANDNTYYDLNGRRVLYPTRGIYVKGNGQKVFIK